MAQSPSKEPFPLISSVSLVPEILLPENLKQSVKVVKTGAFSEWDAFCAPLTFLLHTISPLESRGNRPLEFTFYHQIYTLVYFHVEEYSSGRAHSSLKTDVIWYATLSSNTESVLISSSPS